MKLHKPKRTIWNTAFILFLAALILLFAPLSIPAFFQNWAFWLMGSATLLLLLGTTVI